jgi:branched-chain amino acid transport system permease protein
VALLLLAYPFLAGKLWLTIATQGAILAIGAIGLTVLTGYTGLASLGHAFFLGIGAYTAAFFGGNLGWSFLLWLPLSGIIAGLLGLLIGGLTLRFRGLYLTIVTLGLAFIGGHVFLNLPDLSGGSQGRSFPAPSFGTLNWNASTSDFGPLSLTRDQKFYFLVLPILLLIAWFTHNVTRTRIGRAFQAVRDREVAAELMGINVAWTKITAFVFSAVLGGLCGALFASYLRQVQPDYWNLDLSIQFIAMIIIGGLVSVGGPILGALLLTALPAFIDTFADKLPFVQQGTGAGITKSDLTQIIYALFLALFLVLEPNGVVGIFRRVRARLSQK